MSHTCVCSCCRQDDGGVGGAVTDRQPGDCPQVHHITRRQDGRRLAFAFYAPRKISGEHIVVALSVRPSVSPAVRTTHSCPAHNFVIWSRISKLFYRNDHHVETTCHAQHLGRYLEGHGHSMTLQQNRVRPITSLFEVRFRNYFTEMTTMLRRRVTRKI